LKPAPGSRLRRTFLFRAAFITEQFFLNYPFVRRRLTLYGPALYRQVRRDHSLLSIKTDKRHRFGKRFFSVGFGKFLSPCTCMRIEGWPPKPSRKNARRYEVLRRDVGGKNSLIDLPQRQKQFNQFRTYANYTHFVFYVDVSRNRSHIDQNFA
jgi:hypothetical protein